MKNHEDQFRRDLVEKLPLLKKRARRLAGNKHDAEDLVNDTIMRALRSRNQFEMGTNLGSWLMTIMRNDYLGKMKRAYWQRDRLVKLHAEKDFVTQNPVAIIELKQVKKAIEKLDPIHRDFMERMADGDDNAGLSKEFGLPAGTVKSRLSRAREQLRQSSPWGR